MDSLIDRMRWIPSQGAILDGDRRYVMLRADVLMGIFLKLPPALRQQALEAFAASVRERGGRSLRAYLEAFGGTPERLVNIVERYSPELGWGRWRFGPRTPDALELTVEGSPFAEGFGRSVDPVCHAIVGMLQALGEIVFGQQVTVRESRCAAPHGDGACVFRIAPAVPRAGTEAQSGGEPG